MAKIAIYTAVFGGKDTPKPPLNFTNFNNVDYFLITDNINLKCENYTQIYKKPVFDDITKNARFYKILGLEIFEIYDFVIWHDANLRVIHTTILDTINYVKENEIAFFKHPIRNCVYDEAIKCVYKKKDNPFKVLRQVLRYFKAGVENNVGLYETSIIIKNNRLVRHELLNFWWNELKAQTRRDQLSLPYVLKKFSLIPAILPGERYNNKFSSFSEHNHPNYAFISSKKNKVFNKYYGVIVIKLIKLIKWRNTF